MNSELESFISTLQVTDLKIAVHRLRHTKILLVLGCLAASGCESGSFGSDVGDEGEVAPLAFARVLNASSDGGNAFRSGAEVIISATDSEDPDGPIIDYLWRQTTGPTVVLVEKNASTRSFTVPNAASGTILTFEASVTDSDGLTGTDSVSVEVVDVQDPDRFLSLQTLFETDPKTFFVQPLLKTAVDQLAQSGYEVVAEAFLVYPSTGSNADCRQVLDDRTAMGTDPLTDADIANGTLNENGACLVGFQSDLLDKSRTEQSQPAETLSGSWPLGVDPGISADSLNPRHALKLPKLDVDEFNQKYIESDARANKVELFSLPRAYTAIRIEVSAANPDVFWGTDIEVLTPSDPVSAFPGSSNGPDGIAYEPVGGPQIVWTTVDALLAATSDLESADSAENYYRGIDPDRSVIGRGKRETLNNWLCYAGFAEDDCLEAHNDPALDSPGGRISITLRPEVVTGTDTDDSVFAHATYLNNYDLGFGRDMYARVDKATGYVYAFVNNYATLEGAIRKQDPVVSVVMEFTPPEDDAGNITGGAPFTKFITFAPDGSGDMLRVTSMNFDGRGELYTPGNCVVCHGGSDSPESNGETSGTFLPWDVDSLLYMDTDPAIVDAMPRLYGGQLIDELRELEATPGQFDRDNQVLQIKKLNEAALQTYLHDKLNIDEIQRTAAARELLDGWYGGHSMVPVSGANPLQLPPIESPVLNSQVPDTNYVPDTWDESVPQDPQPPTGAAQVYRDVYGPYCRMCHTNIEDDSDRFNTYAKFVEALGCTEEGSGTSIEFVDGSCANGVYQRGQMPLARLTMDRFWVPFDSTIADASEVLREHLHQASGMSINIPDGGPTAEAVVALIDGRTGDRIDGPVGRGSLQSRTLVQLDGSGSAFADSYSWTLDTPQGSEVELVGATTATPAFQVDLPGDYRVDLVINSGTATESASLANMVVVTNQPPVANQDGYEMVLAEGTQLDSSDVDPPTVLKNDSDPDDANGDLSARLASSATSGNVVLVASGTFIYTFSGDPFAPPLNDQFEYQVSDPYGGVDNALVTISFTAVPDKIPPTAPSNLMVTDVSTTGAASEFLVQLDWDESQDAETSIISYLITRTSSDSSEVEFDVMGGETTYLDDTVQNDTMYTYRVSAFDGGNNESGYSNDATITTLISYRLRIDRIWTDSNLVSGNSCVDCHAGTSPSGDLHLNGSASQNYDCLVGNLGISGCVSENRTEGLNETALIACRPSGACTPHPADDVFNEGADSDEYNRIIRWLEQGAKFN